MTQAMMGTEIPGNTAINYKHSRVIQTKNSYGPTNTSVLNSQLPVLNMMKPKKRTSQSILSWNGKVKFRLSENMNIIFTYN